MSNRRTFLKRTALAGLASVVTPAILEAREISNTAIPDSKAKRALRIAHITDVHLQDQALAKTCFTRALREINSLKDKPDLIINTGDSLMDMNKQTRETVQTGWDIWTRIAKAENKIEMKSVLGNHDVWHGPDDTLDAEYKNDKRYGKQWTIEVLSMPNRYYNFQKNGWHFFGLDSINEKDGFQLDDEQYDWLKDQLSKISASSPICIFSHVPVISMAPMMFISKRNPLAEVKFPFWMMHNDHLRIKDLFAQHKNVKLCLSGHVHYIDTVDYLGVKYMCNGAISGNWWESPLSLDEFPPVYTILDLFQDGTISHQYIHYDTTT